MSLFKYPIYANRTMNGMCHVSFGGTDDHLGEFTEQVETVAFGKLEEFFGPQMAEAEKMRRIEVIQASDLPPEKVRDDHYRIGWLYATPKHDMVFCEIVDDPEDVVRVPDGEHDVVEAELHQVQGKDLEELLEKEDWAHA